MNPLIYKTLRFDEYSRLSIRLNIFWGGFRQIANLKINLKLEKAIH